MNGSLEEQVGGGTVVTKFVWLFFLVSSPVGRIHLIKLPGKGFRIYDNCVPFGGLVFRQIGGAQRKPLSVLLVLKCPRDSVVYSEGVYSAALSASSYHSGLCVRKGTVHF